MVIVVVLFFDESLNKFIHARSKRPDLTLILQCKDVQMI